jgi:hypothetical protein
VKRRYLKGFSPLSGNSATVSNSTFALVCAASDPIPEWVGNILIFQNSSSSHGYTAHHTFSGMLTLYQDDEIITVTDKPVTTLFQLFIKII